MKGKRRKWIDYIVNTMIHRDNDNREKMRRVNEANLYRYQATLNSILEYIHIWLNLSSATTMESNKSVRTETLEGFQAYVGRKIDEMDEISTDRKNKGKRF